MFFVSFKLFLTVFLVFPHFWKPQAQLLANGSNGLDGLNGPDEIGAEPEKGDFIFLVSGGSRAKDAIINVKYMVSIRTRTPEDIFGDNHFCAGTIIRISTVVTAAHCVMSSLKVTFRTRNLLVVAGTPNRLNSETTTMQFPVTSIKVHPNYIQKATNDIAVLRLKGRIPDGNEIIQRIHLPTHPPTFGTTCHTLGWGRMYKKGPLSALALGAEMVLLDPEECLAQSTYYKTDNGMLCASCKSISCNTCRGDDGGPLVCGDEFTGVISWAVGCGDDSAPSIFTDVFHNLDWINSSIRPEGVAAYILIGVTYALFI